MSQCDYLVQQELAQATGELLWIVDDNVSANFIQALPKTKQIKAICNRIDISEQLQRQGVITTLNDFDFSDIPQADQIVYRLSKERLLAQHCIYQAHKTLKTNGELVLIGEKTDGIKTLGKFAEQIFNTSMTIKKHGASYRIVVTRQQENDKSHDYLDTYPELQQIQLDDITFFSKPGVYGWKKIDSGSRLLIATIKPILAELQTNTCSLLDLGCGYGYLQLALADMPFKQRFASDNNVATILAAKENFRTRELEVNLSLDNCAATLREKIDVIICNPPFHQGFAHDKSLINKFVQRSLELINNKGCAYFVVNEFIPLPKTIEHLGGKCALLSHKAGFKVYEITH